MSNRPAGSLNSIVSVEPDQFVSFNMLEVFDYDDHDDIIELYEQAVAQGILHPGFGGRGICEIQPTPDGQPEGALIAYPNLTRHGVLAFIVEVEGRHQMDGMSMYFSDGVEHRLRLESISVSQNRSQAILHGTLNDAIPVSVYEPTFLSDRQWHGEGSHHDVVLYGIPFSIKIGTPPPIEVLDRFKNDGSKAPLHFEGAAMLIPIEDSPASLYSILGPVKRIESYGMNVLDRKVWQVRVTVARIGDEADEDVDIDLFVPDAMWNGCEPPKPGEMIDANIRLCSRLWWANTLRASAPD